jgi:hypothetical protein
LAPKYGCIVPMRGVREASYSAAARIEGETRIEGERVCGVEGARGKT